MDLTKELFNRINKLTRYTRCGVDDEFLININTIWGDFIFKDLKSARSLKRSGYRFTLLGQDIYDRVDGINLPAPHYSYLLLVTYMGDVINPFTHSADLKEVLYDDLSAHHITIENGSVIYASVEKSDRSAGVFIYTPDSVHTCSNISLGSTLGDSLLCLNVNLPYLRFHCKKSLGICKINSLDLEATLRRDCFNITFDTHMNSLRAEKTLCCVYI